MFECLSYHSPTYLSDLFSLSTITSLLLLPLHNLIFLLYELQWARSPLASWVLHFGGHFHQKLGLTETSKPFLLSVRHFSNIEHFFIDNNCMCMVTIFQLSSLITTLRLEFQLHANYILIISSTSHQIYFYCIIYLLIYSFIHYLLFIYLFIYLSLFFFCGSPYSSQWLTAFHFNLLPTACFCHHFELTTVSHFNGANFVEAHLHFLK